MADITPTTIFNHLGRIASVPAATTNLDPIASDIGYDSGALPPRASLARIFTIQATFTGKGDQIVLTKPGLLAGKTGLEITITLNNTAARSAQLMYGEDATNVYIMADAAGTGAVFRVVLDARHSIGR